MTLTIKIVMWLFNKLSNKRLPENVWSHESLKSSQMILHNMQLLQWSPRLQILLKYTFFVRFQVEESIFNKAKLRIK